MYTKCLKGSQIDEAIVGFINITGKPWRKWYCKVLCAVSIGLKLCVHCIQSWHCFIQTLRVVEVFILLVNLRYGYDTAVGLILWKSHVLCWKWFLDVWLVWSLTRTCAKLISTTIDKYMLHILYAHAYAWLYLCVCTLNTAVHKTKYLWQETKRKCCMLFYKWTRAKLEPVFSQMNSCFQ